jgi:hypothetical protein
MNERCIFCVHYSTSGRIGDENELDNTLKERSWFYRGTIAAFVLRDLGKPRKPQYNWYPIRYLKEASPEFESRTLTLREPAKSQIVKIIIF